MKRGILIFLLLVSSAWATTFTEFYCQTTGSNLNAGSTTSDAAAHTYTSAVLAAGWNSVTGVFTVASGNPSGDGVSVGDFGSVYVTSGATVATFVARVTARDTTTITVSLTAVAGSPPATDALGGTTIKIGGAWKGPNGTSGFPFSFIAPACTDASGHYPRVNFKTGTNYAVTAGMTHNVAGPLRFQGYTTTPQDGGKAIFDGGTSGVSYTLFSCSALNNDFADLIFQNNGATSNASGFTVSSNECNLLRVVVHDVTGNGFNISGTCSLSACETYNFNKANASNLAGFNVSGGGILLRCIAHDATAGSNCVGILASSPVTIDSCIVDTVGGKGINISSTNSGLILQTEVYNTTGDGLDFTAASAMSMIVENSNFVKCGGWGINSSGSTIRNGVVRYCGFGNGTQANTSGTINSGQFGAVNITLVDLGNGSADGLYPANSTPWNDPANGDFRITLSQAKNSGFGNFTETQSSYSGTVGYPDIGAAQHLSTSAGEVTVSSQK